VNVNVNVNDPGKLLPQRTPFDRLMVPSGVEGERTEVRGRKYATAEPSAVKASLTQFS